MRSESRTCRHRRFAALAVAGLVLAGLSPTVTATTAAAAPSQTRCGNTQASPTLSVDRSTIGVGETAVVTVTGRSYLLPPHVCGTDVFGGIYLFFGWVQPGGQWGPSFRSSTSTQGLFGTSYSYPGEGGGEETRDDGTGTVRLISFTAGGESGTSTPFHMDAAGNWQSNLTVRGATFSYKDLRSGATSSVDCTVVQCGVFTVGAHGKASRTNERFTPINFVDAAGTPIVPSNADSPAPGGVVTSGGAAAVEGVTPGDDPSASGSGSQAGTSDGTAPSTTGSVGEAPTTTEDLASGDSSTDELETERTASVQDFGSDGAGGSGGPGGVVIGVVLAAMVAATVAAALWRRRVRVEGGRS